VRENAGGHCFEKAAQNRCVFAFLRWKLFVSNRAVMTVVLVVLLMIVAVSALTLLMSIRVCVAPPNALAGKLQHGVGGVGGRARRLDIERPEIPVIIRLVSPPTFPPEV